MHIILLWTASHSESGSSQKNSALKKKKRISFTFTQFTESWESRPETHFTEIILGACSNVTRGWKYAAYLFVQSTVIILILDF